MEKDCSCCKSSQRTNKTLQNQIPAGSLTKDIKKQDKKYANGTYNKKARTTANLNLRKGRGTDFDIIQVIPKGTTLTVSYCLNNWFSTYDFGTVGYVSGDYIELI